MAKSKLVYADHAATSHPKPAAVGAAMADCLLNKGGNPGRGSHRLALAAAEEIYRCREAAAELFGASPERVIFTLNTTHALNLVIKGVMRRGGHALCSDMEHNSVYRPLYRMKADGVIDFDIFDTFPLMSEGRESAILASLSAKIRPDTRLVICAQTSNICSAALPIAHIGAFCRRRGILLAVDAAQAAGSMEIHMERMGIDALCVPGHKGLLGPQGTGMLILGPRMAGSDFLETLMEGGNGMDSLEGGMSADPPERYEAGTLQTPAIAGLCAGIDYVRSVGVAAIGAHEAAVAARLCEMLSACPRVTVYAPAHRGAVVLFSVDGMDSEAVGRALDAEGICVRPGFHCSALGHRTLKTPAGGAVRASFGWCSTERDAERIRRVVKDL